MNCCGRFSMEVLGDGTPHPNLECCDSFIIFGCIPLPPPKQSGPLVRYNLRSTRQTLKISFILGKLILFLKVGLAKKWEKGLSPYLIFLVLNGQGASWDGM